MIMSEDIVLKFCLKGSGNNTKLKLDITLCRSSLIPERTAHAETIQSQVSSPGLHRDGASMLLKSRGAEQSSCDINK